MMHNKVWSRVLWVYRREKMLGNDRLDFRRARETLRDHSGLSGNIEEKVTMKEIDELKSEMDGCRKCTIAKLRHHAVFGEGNLKAPLLFVGEAPGETEDLTGRPFVGRAGKKLREIFAAIGLKEDDFYITNIIKCRPPNNRNPEPSEISNCAKYLDAQIKFMGPKVICALGSFAACRMTGSDLPIGKMRGKAFKTDGAAIIPTYHPSFILRNPAMERFLKDDLELVIRTLKGT